MALTEPNHSEVRRAYQLGRQCFEAGDHEGAQRALTRAVRDLPRWADVHYMLGVVEERLGNLPEATNHLERAVAINPAYAEALLALSSVYEQRGEFDKSRHLAARAQQGLAPGIEGELDQTTRGKLANLHASLGDAYREAGDLREAIDAYRKALDRAPRFHDIRQRLGIALREAGLPSQALAEFQRVLRGNPTYLDAAVQLGLTLYSLGRAAEARAEWEAVLERDPSRDEARMYLRMVAPRFEKPEGGLG
ncbi:MAG: tetratricopeptide repeat protein [Myxococcota bacterium]|nr:tetratricopeptide repeat protein [Myxococcota bacterium]